MDKRLDPIGDETREQIIKNIAIVATHKPFLALKMIKSTRQVLKMQRLRERHEKQHAKAQAYLDHIDEYTKKVFNE